MFTRIGAAALKPDLTNTLTLCEVLGNPQTTFNSIHIAGTNGKGSSSHTLASVLQESGLKVGLYTSPHLKDFRERIKINGKMIEQDKVVEFVQQYKNLFDEVKPSFFEWTVALCFDYFAKDKVDIAIIETGLGGRFDSTNIITPQLSVITNIGWDHMDLLGNTLGKIAFEKAGIIKPNVPVVIGEYTEETKPVFMQKADETRSTISFTQDHFTIKNFSSKNNFVSGDIWKDNQLLYSNVKLDLGGNYQQKNILTVIHALEYLQQIGYTITEEHVRNGCKRVKTNTGLMGRWQILQQEPLIICDTGHNSSGVKYVVEQIQQNSFDQLHMVIGMVKDKDINSVLALLPKNATYYFCNAAIPRSLPSEKLKIQADLYELKGIAYSSVKDALQAAKQQAGKNDLIFIGGSTFVVAEVV
jgi:dihydrofolate synthase/folylpolyglutamate synthase